MKKHRTPNRIAISVCCAGIALIPLLAGAQQSPAPVQIGDTTHSLLAMQSSGAKAGPPRAMLGDEATASYARYIKSFDHPIPAQLGSSVGQIGSSSGDSAGSGGAQN